MPFALGLLVLPWLLGCCGWRRRRLEFCCRAQAEPFPFLWGFLLRTDHPVAVWRGEEQHSPPSPRCDAQRQPPGQRHRNVGVPPGCFSPQYPSTSELLEGPAGVHIWSQTRGPRPAPVITGLPVKLHKPGPLPQGLSPGRYGGLFILMSSHQEIAQQHHSPDPSEVYRLRQGKLRAGDDECYPNIGNGTRANER